MKPNPTAVRVLIASDSVADTAQIVLQLKDEFKDVRASTQADKAVEDFDGFEPEVMVFAFDSLAKAQGHALVLYRGSQKVSQLCHRSILLCQKDELRGAFDLCRKGSFDDYVIYWPQA